MTSQNPLNQEVESLASGFYAVNSGKKIQNYQDLLPHQPF